MREIKIIDNFLEYGYFKHLKEMFTDYNFPWYFSRGKGYGGNEDDGWQLVHLIYWRLGVISDNAYDALTPLFNQLKVCAVNRIKMNLNWPEEKYATGAWHVDTDCNCLTGILYFTTNDGKTIFKSGQEVECVENRFVSFPSNMVHAGISPTIDCKTPKIVMNINYYPEKDL